MIIPISKSRGQSSVPAAPPPDPTFALMAAAQMHSEGRLIRAKSDSTQPKPELNAPSL